MPIAGGFGRGVLLASPLDDWVRSTLPRAVGYARALARNRDEADDIVQDCYSRIIEHAGRYDLPRDGLKILLRSITNACIDRTNRKYLVFPSKNVGEDFSAGIADPHSPDPPKEAIAREMAGLIDASLAKLPATQRAAIYLTSLGYTLPEVAEMIGTTHGNARVLVHRARKSLETDLSRFLIGDET